jgi:site-specific recombinase XerD
MGQQLRPSQRAEQLTKFQKALIKNKLKKKTIRAYTWHIEQYLDFCKDDPRRVRPIVVEKFLNKRLKSNTSHPFFLQACTAIKSLYTKVYDSSDMNLIIKEAQFRARKHLKTKRPTVRGVA